MIVSESFFPSDRRTTSALQGEFILFCFFIWSVCQTVLPSVTHSESKATVNSQISGVGMLLAGSGTRLSGGNSVWQRENGASCCTSTRPVKLVFVPLYFDTAGAPWPWVRPSGKKALNLRRRTRLGGWIPFNPLILMIDPSGDVEWTQSVFTW